MYTNRSFIILAAHDEPTDTLANRIKYYCSRKGITVYKLNKHCQVIAKAFGVRWGDSDIYSYTSGHTMPKANKLSILATVMNVPEAWLCGYGKLHR